MRVYGLFQDMQIRYMFSIPETGDRIQMMDSVREAMELEYDFSDPVQMTHAPLQVWGEREGDDDRPRLQNY